MQSKVKTINPDQIGPAVFRRERPAKRRDLVKLFRGERAEEFVGRLTPGAHIFGFTKGQFSLVDVIRELARQTGPANLTLSTWTVADADLGELRQMVEARAFASVRFLLDFSFQRRQPGLIAQIRKQYGDSAVVVTKNHAKLLLLGNAKWTIVCRTSMNLNFNPRLEDLEIKDDPELYAFVDSIFANIFSRRENQNQQAKSTAELARDFAALD